MFKTLTPILSIVIALALFFFFTKPMFAEIGAIQDETDEYRQAVEKAALFNETLQELVNRQNALTAHQVERLEALVPDTIDQVKALVDIEAIIRGHGMLFGNISVEEPETVIETATQRTGVRSITEDDFATSEISFEFIGTYDQFRAALADIEKSLVTLEILNISFEATNVELQQYKITARLHALAPTE